MAFLYFLVIRCPQPKKEENLVYRLWSIEDESSHATYLDDEC